MNWNCCADCVHGSMFTTVCDADKCPGCGQEIKRRLRWHGALMVLIQSAETDLNLSRLLTEETETGSKFQVLIDRGKKE